jgi:hypothetical protein
LIAVQRKGLGVSVNGVPNYDTLFEKLPPNAQLNHQQSDLIRGQLNKIAKPLAEARKLKDMPYGRFKITISPDFIGTLIPDHHKTRDISDWLQHDAYLLAHDDQPDQAVESCQAIFNAGRTMGDEEFLITHRIRIAVQTRGVITLERVLAQGEASDETLAHLQALLAKEIAESTWSHGIRGERAGRHMLCTNLRSGKVNITLLRGLVGKKRPIGVQDWLHKLFPSTALTHYPEHLQHLNEIVALSKRPLHEQRKRLDEMNAAFQKQMSSNPTMWLFAPAYFNVYDADCRSQAYLRSTQVALACERYRLKHEHWPKLLDVLVKEKLLGAIPLDPFDGQPLRYRHTQEGGIVYSVGVDQIDNEGHLDHAQVLTPGFDIGIRLWDRDLRRQAPLPLVALPE